MISNFNDLNKATMATLKNESGVLLLKKNNRIDIVDIEIKNENSVALKYQNYIDAVQNPYSFKVNNIDVDLRFNKKTTLNKAFCNIAKNA